MEISKITQKQICSTYNSYIIKAEKTAVINLIPSEDAADADKYAAVDYIVITGTSPACADILEEILKRNGDVIVAGTTTAIRNCREMLNHGFNEYVVKNGAALDLGGAVLRFYIAPNLNQPDTMLVYEETSGILFSGMLFSSYDTMDGAEWFYSENLSMYSEYADSASDIAANLKPAEIYPYIGEERSAEECALRYTLEKPAGKTASVYYSSVYGYTKMMAEAIADGLRGGGVQTQVFDAESSEWDAMTGALSADILLFGSSTVHRNASEKIWRLISEIDAVGAPKKLAAAFGSYGWSGEGARIVEGLLKTLKLRVYKTAQTAVYKPTDERLAELRAFGGELARE